MATKPIATDMFLSFPVNRATPKVAKGNRMDAADSPTVRVIIAFGNSIRGMPTGVSVQFEQCVSTPPSLEIDASGFTSKYFAKMVRGFVRRLSLIEGVRWGCLMNGSLLIDIAYGTDTGTTVKDIYDALEEHTRLFAHRIEKTPAAH